MMTIPYAGGKVTATGLNDHVRAVLSKDPLKDDEPRGHASYQWEGTGWTVTRAKAGAPYQLQNLEQGVRDDGKYPKLDDAKLRLVDVADAVARGEVPPGCYITSERREREERARPNEKKQQIAGDQILEILREVVATADGEKIALQERVMKHPSDAIEGAGKALVHINEGIFAEKMLAAYERNGYEGLQFAVVWVAKELWKQLLMYAGESNSGGSPFRVGVKSSKQRARSRFLEYTISRCLWVYENEYVNPIEGQLTFIHYGMG